MGRLCAMGSNSLFDVAVHASMEARMVHLRLLVIIVLISRGRGEGGICFSSSTIRTSVGVTCCLMLRNGQQYHHYFHPASEVETGSACLVMLSWIVLSCIAIYHLYHLYKTSSSLLFSYSINESPIFFLPPLSRQPAFSVEDTSCTMMR